MEIKKEKVKLTEDQKKEICKYKQLNPDVNQKDIADWFNLKYKRTISVPTVSYTLRNSIHNLDIDKAIEKMSLSKKYRVNKHNKLHPMTSKSARTINNISSSLDYKNVILFNIEKKADTITNDMAIDHIKSLINFFTYQNGDFTKEIIDLANIMKSINRL